MMHVKYHLECGRNVWVSKRLCTEAAEGVGVKELVEEVCCRGGERGGGDASEWGHCVFYADNSVNTV